MTVRALAGASQHPTLPSSRSPPGLTEMRPLLILLLLLPLLAQAVPCPLPQERSAKVSAIIDGDTLVVDGGERIRIIGIDTPERGRDGKPGEPYAKVASDYLARLIPPGTTIGLAFDNERQDKYGRTLAHVLRANGEPVAVALLENGYARTLVIAPNTRQASCYAAIEERARQQRRGIWSQR